MLLTSLQVEVRSVALEKQVKEMAGLQLQLDTEQEEKRLLQEQLQEAEVSAENLSNMKTSILSSVMNNVLHCAYATHRHSNPSSV